MDPTGEFAQGIVLPTFALITAGIIVESSRPAGLTGKLESLWDKVCRTADDPCDALRKEISTTLSLLQEKYGALRNDPFKLFIKAYDQRVEGLPGTWKGHLDQYEKLQARLRGLVELARKIPCTYDPQADIWINTAPPSRPRNL